MDAVRLYAEEAVPRIEEDLVTPADGYRQPEAPWSQGIKRRETARGFKGFLRNNEFAERHRHKGFKGDQRHGGECEFIGDSEDEVPGVGF
jgi:hypothetical protein